ncbi:MAG: translation initiation factor [Methanopyri archaeon]|jgi:translation initiation factor 1|nr:translation initiation factor [Methanopyri archaeon]
MQEDEICPVCGLPKELCVCEEVSKETVEKIKIYTEQPRPGKIVTIIEGLDDAEIDLRELASKLKRACACGGTAKEGKIILQGDHRQKVREFLIKEEGFPEDAIEVS